MSKKYAQTALFRFIHHEATAGLCLALAALLALILTNVGLGAAYHHFLELPVILRIGSVGLEQSLLHFINDGLMAVFFFLVGLEIKREVAQGHLSSMSQFMLPALAALGGMVAPALIYSYFNWGDVTLKGWAIPAATDIAFALGALALLGARVPPSLKVFVLALATLDDLAAIVIIALFYTADLSLLSLGLASALLGLLILLNRLHVDKLAPYLILGTLLWACVLQSGIHATLAGVAVAFTIPLKSSGGQPILARLESSLHPYVAFLILPLFAFANAGIDLSALSPSALTSPLSLGVMGGLALGKPLGIMLAVGGTVMLGLAKLPLGASWWHMLGAGCLAGIGFTMSLFIGTLAFDDPGLIDVVRLSVIGGSLLSLVIGVCILMLARQNNRTLH